MAIAQLCDVDGCQSDLCGLAFSSLTDSFGVHSGHFDGYVTLRNQMGLLSHDQVDQPSRPAADNGLTTSAITSSSSPRSRTRDTHVRMELRWVPRIAVSDWWVNRCSPADLRAMRFPVGSVAE